MSVNEIADRRPVEQPLQIGLIVNTDDHLSENPRQRMVDLVDRARNAVDQGFDHLAVAHRYSYGPARKQADSIPLTTARFQPLPLLARLAGEFDDAVGYLTTVLVSPGLHPVQLAEDIATVDAMVPGRLRVGIGLGWLPYEFEAFGLRSQAKARRFEEFLQCYLGLTSGDALTFRGGYFDADDVTLSAYAAQDRVPLWIGANAWPGVDRAARLGDAWIMSAHNTVDDLVTLQEKYFRTVADVGRSTDQDRPISRIVHVASDRETALQQAEADLAAWYRKRGEWGWFVTQNASLADAVLGSGRWIIGSPDDCVQQILELRNRLGVTHVIMSMAWPTTDNKQRIDAIRCLGTEVLPKVREAVASTDGGMR